MRKLYQHVLSYEKIPIGLQHYIENYCRNKLVQSQYIAAVIISHFPPMKRNDTSHLTHRQIKKSELTLAIHEYVNSTNMSVISTIKNNMPVILTIKQQMYTIKLVRRRRLVQCMMSASFSFSIFNQKSFRRLWTYDVRSLSILSVYILR